MMAVRKSLRDRAGVNPGDIVSVVMERDKAERTVEVPPALKKDLAKSKTAQGNWDKLALRARKEIATVDCRRKAGRNARTSPGQALNILKTGKKWTG